MVLLALGFLVAINFDKLPMVGGTLYNADFSESAGLVPGNEVRISGVKVGTVSDVALDGDHVKVSFRVKDAWLGDQTRAAIKIKSLLGQKYLALDSHGTRELSASDTVPLQRTMAPFDVVQALSGLSNDLGQIDTQQLAQSFNVMSQTFANTPNNVHGALTGLSALSETIAKRDAQLKELLSNTNQVSKTIADRDAEFQKLLADSNLLLSEVKQRREAINGLLVGTRNLSVQLTGLVSENSAQLGPTLQQLNQVTAMLQHNQDNLDRTIKMMAPFTRLLTNTAGNGRWIDAYICGLLPPAVGPINQAGCYQ